MASGKRLLTPAQVARAVYGATSGGGARSAAPRAPRSFARVASVRGPRPARWSGSVRKQLSRRLDPGYWVIGRVRSWTPSSPATRPAFVRGDTFSIAEGVALKFWTELSSGRATCSVAPSRTAATAGTAAPHPSPSAGLARALRPRRRAVSADNLRPDQRDLHAGNQERQVWAGTCRQLNMRLADGSWHQALFRFS